MKRIVKNPDVRRAELLLVAKKLFEEKGYSKTTVENIINEAGIAKGTFYYYFKAKQDVLQALVEYIGIDMTMLFNEIAERDDLNAMEKLHLMLRGPEKQAKTGSAVMALLHKPENRELQEQLNIQSVQSIAPLMGKVLKQGKKEGLFKNTVSVESIQLLLAGTEFVLDSGLFDWDPQKRFELLKSAQHLFELIVGVKPGTLGFISEEN